MKQADRQDPGAISIESFLRTATPTTVAAPSLRIASPTEEAASMVPPGE
jgi:hypothetical protein